ncbi:hypothetical protein [Halolamina sp.]|jgi:hypothetical protein|uniref:hypothetical protein n=1 Tax=Halolamina sp. TaxID=1940283 RepID=UPI000223B78B|nr:hypothetical protein Halar_0721 [halophilic archaeon DL31]
MTVYVNFGGLVIGQFDVKRPRRWEAGVASEASTADSSPLSEPQFTRTVVSGAMSVTGPSATAAGVENGPLTLDQVSRNLPLEGIASSPV